MVPSTSNSDAVGTFTHVGGEHGGLIEVFTDGHDPDATATD